MVDRIVRSRRKTLSIHISPNGEVVVRAPLLMPQKLIKQAVMQNSKWISRQRDEYFRRQAEHPPPAFKPGDQYYFLGEKYPLEFTSNSAFSRIIELAGCFKTMTAEPEIIRKRLIKWYRKEAEFYLNERVQNLSELHNWEVSGIKINSASRRWGSCTSRGTLNFPWRLVMCPPEIIDYVIMHELAHLKEMNHSSRFWHEVEKMCPDFNRHRKYLRENAHKFKGF
ncbi:SprT family zinc-dependent metalloprotease [Lentisphaerota bacterium ZTH]|nr:M48 family metallopeptidase [Lentisphaerota bacterium]WET07122.1 SprT family zinc-dependent metalloprotease [Lentisphaerota bacterium ZTH]